VDERPIAPSGEESHAGGRIRTTRLRIPGRSRCGSVNGSVNVWGGRADIALHGADDSLRERREAIVREHMESENRHEFDATLQTFDHPRYEIVPTGEVHDGPEQVAEYFRATRAAFPDQRNENAILHHADDAVIVEFDLLGTHEGEIRGIAPTGRSFRCRVAAFFLFAPGGDRIICERVYFDQATVVEQLLDDTR
jgi:steroid delta-isomerase-like uncharacterized protein